MVIGIISDTHDNIPALKEALDVMKKMGVNTVFHLGDIVSPFMVPHLDLEMVYAVFGNNDGDRILLKERFEKKGFRIFKGPHSLNFQGKKILMMHEPFQVQRFRKEDFDIILFGHTHKVFLQKDRCLIINPGELSGWLTGKRTFVTLNIESMEPELHVL